MADQFDLAQDLEAMATQSAIDDQQRKAATAARLIPVGYCLNPACEEPFAESSRLFCNPQCGAEHKRRAKT